MPRFETPRLQMAIFQTVITVVSGPSIQFLLLGYSETPQKLYYHYNFVKMLELFATIFEVVLANIYYLSKPFD